MIFIKRMPQRNLRHSHYIYSNHSDNKLITLFCNQFATTPPKNPVFSGISSVFLLFELVSRRIIIVLFCCDTPIYRCDIRWLCKVYFESHFYCTQNVLMNYCLSYCIHFTYHIQRFD